MFLCQKSLHTEFTEIHRILLRMLLRMSAPSARDNNAPHGISVNSCPLVAQKKYEKIRVHTWREMQTDLAIEGIQGMPIEADARAVRPYRSSEIPHANETP